MKGSLVAELAYDAQSTGGRVMVAYKTESRASSQYQSWQGLLRAACASAERQPSMMVRAISVSHRIDELFSGELHALLDFTSRLATNAGLEAETEETASRLTVRFYRPTCVEASNRDVLPSSLFQAVRHLLPLGQKQKVG